MAAHAPAAGHTLETNTGLDNRKLLMWFFLASDCLFFGSFIAAYLLYRDRNVNGPYQADLYDIPFTSVSSFVLLMSSLTMVLALSAIQKGDLRKMRIWLIATALLGLGEELLHIGHSTGLHEHVLSASFHRQRSRSPVP